MKTSWNDITGKINDFYIFKMALKKNNYKENLSCSVLFTFTLEIYFLIDMLESGIKPRLSFERNP